MLAKVRPTAPGFTILEVMIFLAISSVMLVSAVTAISGKQQQVEFSQGVRDFNSTVQDTMNEVSTGFFPNTGTHKCEAVNPGDAPSFPNTAVEQGKNQDCVFLGKVIQFTTGDDFNIYTVVGRRRGGVPVGEVQTYSDAKPVAVADPGFDLTAHGTLKWGIHVTKIADPDAPGTPVGSIALLSSLPKYGGGYLTSGNQSIYYAAVPGSVLADDQTAIVNRIQNMAPTLDVTPPAPKGIVICLSDPDGRTATVTVGGGGQTANARLDIDQGVCP